MGLPTDHRTSEQRFNAFVRERLRIVRTENLKRLPPSVRLLRHFLNISLVALLAGYAYEVIAPVVEQGFSKDSLSHFAVTVFLLAGGIPLARFYEKTKLSHLPLGQRAVANFLLCAGGLAFLGAGLLLRLEHYLGVLVVLGVSFFLLRFAGQYAKNRA